MATYQELIVKYKKRQHDTVMDAVAAGLAYADNVAVDLGLLQDTGIVNDVLDTVCVAAPFVLIAVTEQFKVIMGKKTGRAGMGDAVYRMLKTGAAMGVGALAGAAGGVFAALPAAMGTRAMMDKYKSKALTSVRVAGRVERLRGINAQIQKRQIGTVSDTLPALPPGVEYIEARATLHDNQSPII